MSGWNNGCEGAAFWWSCICLVAELASEACWWSGGPSLSSWWSGSGVSCLQVGRSRCSERCCCAGESVELMLVVGVSGVCCSSAPEMLDGGGCVDLSEDVAPRDGTVTDGRCCCLVAPKVCCGLAW